MLRSGKEIKKIDYSNLALTDTQKPSEVNFLKIEPFNSEPETMFNDKRKEPMPYQTPVLFP